MLEPPPSAGWKSRKPPLRSMHVWSFDKLRMTERVSATSLASRPRPFIGERFQVPRAPVKHRDDFGRNCWLGFLPPDRAEEESSENQEQGFISIFRCVVSESSASAIQRGDAAHFLVMAGLLHATDQQQRLGKRQEHDDARGEADPEGGLVEARGGDWGGRSGGNGRFRDRSRRRW